jgi:hypothetical protein
MTERTFTWNPAGAATLATSGLTLAEALEGLNAPDGFRKDHWYGDTLLTIAGLASSGRVVYAACLPVEGYTDVFTITYIGTLRGAALEAFWKELR